MDGRRELEAGDLVETDGGQCAEVLCSFSNGVFTSLGLYSESTLAPAESGRVAWHSDAALDLPAEWPYMLWEDDAGFVQKIRKVYFDKVKMFESCEEPVFLMEDGHRSWYVTETELSVGRRE